MEVYCEKPHNESVALCCCDESFQVTVTKAEVQRSRTQCALSLIHLILPKAVFIACNNYTSGLIISPSACLVPRTLKSNHQCSTISTTFYFTLQAQTVGSSLAMC